MFSRLYTHHFFRNHNYYDREAYENILKDPKSKLWRKLNRIIEFCVILGVAVIVFETVQDYSQRYGIYFFIIDALVSLVFAGEYLYRFFRSKDKMFFVKRPLNIIDFLSFWPFFIGLIFLPFAGLDMLKVLRLFRVLRLFEVSAHSPIALGFGRTLRAYSKEYQAILSIFISFLVVISTLVYYFEMGNNQQFASIPHTLWWGIVTMTTVGYGDMTPITLWGRVFWVFLILLWPVLLAVISSITILVFMDVAEANKQSLYKTCSKCRTKNNDEANFCMQCGEKHFISGIIETKRPKLKMITRLFSKK